MIEKHKSIFKGGYAYSPLNRDVFKLFKKNNPNIKITYTQYRGHIIAYMDKLCNELIENHRGFRMPGKIGSLMIYGKRTTTKSINWKVSNEVKKEYLEANPDYEFGEDDLIYNSPIPLKNYKFNVYYALNSANDYDTRLNAKLGTCYSFVLTDQLSSRLVKHVLKNGIGGYFKRYNSIRDVQTIMREKNRIKKEKTHKYIDWANEKKRINIGNQE
jgi:hypothetical protein